MVSEDVVLAPDAGIRHRVWEVNIPFGRAARWLRGIALVHVQREREWYEPDKYASNMPFLKDEWPRGWW